LRIGLAAALVWAAVAARGAAQQAEAGPLLEPGIPVRGRVTASEPVVTTETISREYAQNPVRAKAFHVRVAEPGAYHVELRSFAFDTYLILRDEDGTVLGEDDDGLYSSHARLAVAELAPGKAYRVEACALHGEFGEFEILLRAGAPDAVEPQARRELELEDARESVRWTEDRRGPDALPLATRLDNLGLLLLDHGRAAESLPVLERAVAIRTAALGDVHPLVATSAQNLARCRVALGQLAEARAPYRQALDIWLRTLGADHPATASCMSSLGVLLRQLGEFDAARELLEQTPAILERGLGADHPALAVHLSNLAVLFMDLRDFEEARPLLERALAIQERAGGPESPALAPVLNNLALTLHYLGQYQDARMYYERALALSERHRGPRHPDTARCLANLAALHSSLREHASAVPLLERAVAILEAANGPDHLDVAQSLDVLSMVLAQQGGAEAAARSQVLQERVLRIRDEALGEGHPLTAASRFLLGERAHRESGSEPALEQMRQAIAVFERTFGLQSMQVANLRARLAFVLADRGEDQVARDEVARALAAGRAGLAENLLALTESERFLFLAQSKGQLELLVDLGGLGDSGGEWSRTYNEVVNWKGLSSRVFVAGRRAAAGSNSRERRQQLDVLQGLQARISAQVFAPPSGDAARDRRELDRLRSLRNEVELQIQRHSEAREGPASIRIDALQGSLPEGTALLDFFLHRSYQPGTGPVPGAWGDVEISAWVVRPGSVVRVDLGSAEPIRSALNGFLNEIADRRGGEALPETAGESRNDLLLRTLWNPLAVPLEGAGTVLVAPDGFLATLPFEVLRLESGRYLIEDRAFVYLLDAQQVLDRERPAGGARRGLLAVGGVDYDRRETEAPQREAAAPGSIRGSWSERWYPLDWTRYEAESLTAEYQRAREEDPALLLQGAAATERRLKAEMPRHGFLHVATHGFFQPEGLPSMWEDALDEQGRPLVRMGEVVARLVGNHPGLLSGLVLAGANLAPLPGQEDGFLTAEEVAWLDLTGVELVVLSACETALGRTQSGEGLMGLRRAFRVAGARTVISTLWAVEDRSSSDLMLAFYRKLWVEGRSKLQALRRAQLEMLRSNRAEFGDGRPATWGAFVLSGDWR